MVSRLASNATMKTSGVRIATVTAVIQRPSVIPRSPLV
jgi:hypothetical protein